jgi:hypothetical protein
MNGYIVCIHTHIYYSKRYFVCPPKTGLFILAIKVLKQQQHLHLINRPSTPHNNISSPTLKHARALPPLPKKATLNNNELLQKRIEALETENRMLKEQASLNNQSERILVLEQSLIEVKKASMDSIEILENMVQSHQNTIHQLSNQLDKEKQKNQTLLEEQNDLRKAGLEAIESYESTLAGLEQQKVKSRQSWEQSQQKTNKTHQREVKILLKDIVVLEQVLETRMTREAELLDSIKKERQNNLKLTAELKAMKFQVKINTNYNDNSRWSLFNKDRLDTPIEEVEEEEEEEDLLDDNILSICALCEKKGHHLIHCHMLTPTKK